MILVDLPGVGWPSVFPVGLPAVDLVGLVAVVNVDWILD